MATLVELNSEPAVEELSKQILSEAKLWEAIQEARAELRQRHEQQVTHSLAPPLTIKVKNCKKYALCPVCMRSHKQNEIGIFLHLRLLEVLPILFRSFFLTSKGQF